MRVFSSLVAIAAVVAATAAESSRRLVADKRGWYKCPSSTFEDPYAAEEKEDGSGDLPIVRNYTEDVLYDYLKGTLNNDARDAECAVFHAPLCYEGVCEDPQNRKTDVFFKRIVADAEDPTQYPNVWFIQGGPGAASPAMESAMIETYARMKGKVNVYTMDHRGTGRSTKLDCVAAQATVSGGLAGTGISPLEVPECAHELQIKYGDLAAFSITTAASDMAMFISGETPGSETYVFGVSYGTAVVERLIHLAPPEVKGYILDGIATTSGADLDKFSYFSTWDYDFGETGRYFLEKCATSADCSPKFKDKDLVKSIEELIVKFETEPESKCARVVNNLNGGIEPPALLLRRSLGTLLPYSSLRTLIPPLVYRMSRCNDEDVKVLEHYFTALDALLSGGVDEEGLLYSSDLLYYLIVYSDMWEQPTPDEKTFLKRFTDTLISNGASYYSIPRYCAFSKEKSEVCDRYEVGNYEANPLLYKRDKYWNVAAKVPEGSSVLLMSSWLDPQTPHKYAEYLLEAIDGEMDVQKKMATFEHATHGVLWTTPYLEEETAPTCGMEILLSYISNKANLTNTDMGCLELMPEINMKVPERWLSRLLSTDDAYDGKFVAESEEEYGDSENQNGESQNQNSSSVETPPPSHASPTFGMMSMAASALVLAVASSLL